MTNLTLAQKRAAHAHAAAQDVAGMDPSIRGEYVRRVRSLPAAIIANGLGQALATVKKNANDPKESRKQAHQRLRDDLNGWFCAYPNTPLPKDQDLLAALLEQDQAFYVWAQEESLLYLGWLKTLAVAYCDAEHNNV